MTAIEASYAYCAGVARARARNFYYSFLALPKQKRLSMCALYAFMRECDDLSDEEGATLAAIEGWRGSLDETLAGKPAQHPVWPALLDTVTRYAIPGKYLHEMIDGVSSDLTPHKVESFDDLYRYCYLVASVVGITTIHVFGFRGEAAIPLAEKCGIAFQLTNIIRDVKEDAQLGRVYLPSEDLEQFGVKPELLQGELTPELRRLLEYEASRARRYYDESRPLLKMVDKDSQGALWALVEIYSRLLGRIEQRGFDVMRGRIRLSSFEKSAIALRAMTGLA
ncbi:MAG: phytoene/squalene synthase family protein [Acidobacteria bacterium]|nr:phytoene/squalene synthase family protein [Acidobacteriota bacterium]